MWCAHLEHRPEGLQVNHEVEKIWGDPNRPESPDKKDVPVVNPDRVKYSQEVYEEILETVEDEAKIKREKAKLISAMFFLLIGLVVGFPLLWIWRRVAHGDRVWRVEVDAFVEEEMKLRRKNEYI